MFSVFGSIAMERVISILGFLIVGIFAVILIKLPSNIITINNQAITGLKITFAVFLMLCVLIILVKKYRKNVSTCINYVIKKNSKKRSIHLFQLYENFVNGLRFGKNKKDITLIISYSILIRIVFALITLSIARGFGIELSVLTFWGNSILFSSG